MTADQAVGTDHDVEVPDYIAMRSFVFAGKQFHKGDPITLAVHKHRRFESLISTGLIRAVSR